MLHKKITIENKLGLHARAAAKFVDHAARYTSQIKISRQNTNSSVNGKSIMEVMALAISKGNTIDLEISGNDEQDMLRDLEALIKNKFDEAD